MDNTSAKRDDFTRSVSKPVDFGASVSIGNSTNKQPTFGRPLESNSETNRLYETTYLNNNNNSMRADPLKANEFKNGSSSSNYMVEIN